MMTKDAFHFETICSAYFLMKNMLLLILVTALSFAKFPFIFDILTGAYICFCLIFSNSITLKKGNRAAVSADAKQFKPPDFI